VTFTHPQHAENPEESQEPKRTQTRRSSPSLDSLWLPFPGGPERVNLRVRRLRWSSLPTETF
jgi:hypothetical protein